VITTEIDFTTATDQTDAVEPYRDSPTANEMAEMVAIGVTLKAYHDAQTVHKAAKTAFSSNFTIDTAKRILAFRDAYWEKDKNGYPIGRVLIGDKEMSWNDFVETVFGVTRRWFNEVMKRTLFPTGKGTDVTSKSELIAYVKSLDEDGASALLGQINDNFETDEDEGDEPTLDDVDEGGLDDADADEQPTAIDEATARIHELETEVEQLKAQQATELQDEELLTEKEKVFKYAKRISCGNAAILKRVLDEIVEKLGFSDRITVTVE
jgi:DNA-directed RNA polymerase subunit F